MTDKQIIIDGIDVSGCEFYKNTNWKNCYSRDYKESVCQSNPNCYYKQLKRKEQECKNNKIAYQMELDIYNQECLNLQQELTEALEQLDQLDQLNEQLEAYKMEAEEGKEINAELKAENDELKKVSCKFKDYCTCDTEKLKKTLTEIKEIAEKIDDSSGCAYGDYDCDNCSSLEQETVCTYKVKKLILQKISEVEDD